MYSVNYGTECADLKSGKSILTTRCNFNTVGHNSMLGKKVMAGDKSEYVAT
jgi:hypothetical protein